MQHILSADQFSSEELLALFEQAKELQESESIPQALLGKILVTAFFEPSTRTRLSFESAMLRQGGQVISITDVNSTSLKKGESLQDTAKILSINSDIIVARTPEAGMAAKLAEGASVPIINAGDGTGEHPTQHLLDLYTIWKERGSIDGLTIGLMGDCKNSRVLRGMARMLCEFDIKLIFISPEELNMKEDVKQYIESKGRSYQEVRSLEEVIADLDVLDVNRIRHEYFEDQERAKEIGKQFILGADMVKKGKEELIVLDPLPRINTVQEDVDDLPQAKYFEAAENGVYMRMVLLRNALS